MDAFAHYQAAPEVDEDELPEVTMEEVAQHNSPEDLWVVVYGLVYDVTEWQHSHPGGDAILQDHGGQDASAVFRAVQHSKDALSLRGNFVVAKLAKPKPEPAQPRRVVRRPGKL